MAAGRKQVAQHWFLMALEQPKQPNKLAGGGLGWLKKVLVGIGLVSGASASSASASDASFAQRSVNLTEALIDAKTKSFDSSDVLTPLNSALNGLRSVTDNGESMLSGVADDYFLTLKADKSRMTTNLFVTPFATTVNKLIAYGVSLGYLDPSSDLDSKSQHLESDEISKLMYVFNDITSANVSAPPLSLSPHLSPIVSLYVNSVNNNMTLGLDTIKNTTDTSDWEANKDNYKLDAVYFASSVAVVMQEFMTEQTNAYIQSKSMTDLTKQILKRLFVHTPNNDTLFDAARNLGTSVFGFPIPSTLTAKARLNGMVNKLTIYFNKTRVGNEFKKSLSKVVELYKNYESFEQNVSDFEPPFWTWSTTLVAVSGLMALLGGSLWGKKIIQHIVSQRGPLKEPDTSELEQLQAAFDITKAVLNKTKAVLNTTQAEKCKLKGALRQLGGLVEDQGQNIRGKNYRL